MHNSTITEQEMRGTDEVESRYSMWANDIAQACQYNPKQICMVFLMALEVVNAHSLRRQVFSVVQSWLSR